MKNKISVTTLLQKKKNNEKITMLTAYDYSTAKLLDESGIDILLVGDSLGMVILGYDSTIPVTMDEMLHHTKAVSRGAENAMVIGDMPFMSYQSSVDEALRNAGRFLKEAGANGVKLEGGYEVTDKVKAIVGAGIPVIGHLGLTPQSINQLGGYGVQGKDEKAAAKIEMDAKALEDAGAFSVVLESVPGPLAKRISDKLTIPTIGIGAGPDCDGQVLVTNDMLGLFTDFTPKFVKQYAKLHIEIKNAVKGYVDEVKSGKFPSSEHTY